MDAFPILLNLVKAGHPNSTRYIEVRLTELSPMNSLDAAIDVNTLQPKRSSLAAYRILGERPWQQFSIVDIFGCIRYSVRTHPLSSNTALSRCRISLQPKLIEATVTTLLGILPDFSVPYQSSHHQAYNSSIHIDQGIPDQGFIPLEMQEYRPLFSAIIQFISSIEW